MLYLVERELQGAHLLTDDEVCDIREHSIKVAKENFEGIHWHTSYIVADKFICIYDDIRRHAEIGKFPLTSITPIARVVPGDATE